MWLLISAALLSSIGARAESGDTPSSAAGVVVDYGRVGYVRIDGVIDRMRERYLERVITQARADRLDTLVVHIDTDGGQVLHARKMFKRVLDQARDGPRMLAFVDFRAISAGAMIAYAHEAIYVSPTASIGDIGVIFRKPDGEISYAPEKIETVVRTLLAQAAEQRGWDRALLMKMTARNQKLYRISLSDGERKFVIEDDLPEFLAAHPEVNKDDERQVLLYRGEDRLLTLTGNEALDLGMASARAASLDALYAKLDIDPSEVVDLAPRKREQVAWWLASFAPLLAGLGLLFILFEIKTPGVGLWAALGALCAGLFLVAQFSLELINNLELILIVLGSALLFAELLTAVGGGLIGILGAGVLFSGLVLGFLPNELDFDIADPRFTAALGEAALRGIYTVAILTGGIIVFVILAPRSALARGLALRREMEATSAGAQQGASLVAKRGIAVGAMRPGGLVRIDGDTHRARTEHGAYIDAGVAVEVARVEFGELVVHAIDGGSKWLAPEVRP